MSLLILDLPTEVLEHIFSFVSHKKDRRNLALICKKFKKIVRQQSKKHNSIDLLNNQKNSHLSIFEQSKEFPFQNISFQYKQIEEYRSVWLKFGANLTQMTLKCSLDELVTFGVESRELFPNLKSLNHQQTETRQYPTILEDFFDAKVKGYFSEKIEDLYLNSFNNSIKLLDQILRLFPGLKRLKIKFFVEEMQNGLEVQDLKDLLDNWLPKVERIELSFATWCFRLHLLETFDKWADEKLFFEDIELSLIQENVSILKSFFGVTRHIKTLLIHLQSQVQDTNLNSVIGLIDNYAKIDCLIIYNYSGIPNLDGFIIGIINARGVEEINIQGKFVSSFDQVHFTPEALLKVKEFSVRGDFVENVFNIPLFHNLRNLTLRSLNVGNEELDFIVNNFPFLEYLEISHALHATNGHSLTNLKHLQSLLLNSTQLPDSFFIFDSQLPNLETLRISRVPNLSYVEIKSIVTHCPKIQILEFNCLGDITEQRVEECVELIVRKLFYIEKIYITCDLELSSLQKKYPELVLQ